MTRSPDSLIPFDAGQPASKKRDDKAFQCGQEGEANLRAATEVNANSASSTLPAITPIQLDLFPGRACGLTAKPATIRRTARDTANCRDGVQGGSTQRQIINLTGETLFGPAEATPAGRVVPSKGFLLRMGASTLLKGGISMWSASGVFAAAVRCR